MSVRRAAIQDTPALVRMACRFIAESSYRGVVTPDPLHQAKLVAFLQDHGGLFVAERRKLLEPVGFIAFAATPAILTGELTACEVGWWVEPEFRKGGAGLELLDAGEEWARHIGAGEIQMIAPIGSDVDVTKIYQRRGYRPLETLWSKRLVA